MEEIIEPRVLQDIEPRRRKLWAKWTDIIIFLVIIGVIIGLVVFIINKVTLKHDVTSAELVTNKVIADLGKRDGQAAYALGSSKFKSTYTATRLTQQFKAIELVTGGNPTVDQELHGSGPKGKTVVIIYKYPAHLAKLPYYVSVSVSEKSGSPWELQSISGSANESQLLQ